ncbi:Gfo/Idh/MocA family protein [Commensalibacter communis]|uniref:Gfo/Idh/MocA family protein n=1 Tax=Commensalibacter communis TaxID=2972786 RepID=UPI0022FF78D7|nr:Gfo/Idh/MocA family oxidoreductase [Commensalibacter communis]CAI3949183.1 Predicted dehydrogenase (MviM) (PDB:3UUW) [Commensalibacter communis]CAI3949411.1 Predicted dehydrogenase (MviM) (PDB:3UUW) [Commensalibacter communis]
MKEKTMLRVGIAGAGYFGRFHALKAAASKREELIGIYDPIIENAERVGKEAGNVPYMPLDELLDQCDALIIAAPAEEHYRLAVQAIQVGKHVLIEKPIASTLEQADHLIELSKEKNVVLQVGHLLRYSAEQKAITERIKRPLYIETTRIAPFKPRGVDVSVVLDLMIHDLDLVMAIVNSPIDKVDALGAAVTSEFEDIANARVTFVNGCVATIAASRISLKTERKMRIFSEEGYLSADFMEKQLVMIGREKGLPLPGTNGFRREAVKWKDHDNLEQEHAAFAASCLDGAPVIVDAVAGRNALEAALAVINSVKESRERMQASGLLSPKKMSF